MDSHIFILMIYFRLNIRSRNSDCHIKVKFQTGSKKLNFQHCIFLSPFLQIIRHGKSKFVHSTGHGIEIDDMILPISCESVYIIRLCELLYTRHSTHLFSLQIFSLYSLFSTSFQKYVLYSSSEMETYRI